MIDYEGAKFHPSFMVKMRGSVMPFSCAVALPCALLACALKLLSQTLLDDETWDVLGIDHKSHQVISAAFSGMNFLIGFLVVFRAQQAYSRFWEGCTAICTMQGEWFDAASALVAFTKCSKATVRDVLHFQHTLVRLLSLMNACVLMELSSGIDEDFSSTMLKTKRAFELEIIDGEGLDSQSLRTINSTQHKVQLLFTWIQQLIVEYDQKQVFSVAAPILSRTFQVLGNGMVGYRQAYKIATVPLPFPYVQATEMLLASHWLIIPFLMCVWVSSPLWTGLLTFVQVAFFWSLNSIATELENPFGEDVNDLPAQVMQQDFNTQLLLLLRPSTGVTASLSHKSVLNEINSHDASRRMLSRMISLGKKGLSLDAPRLHAHRSDLEGVTSTFASLQLRVNEMEDCDYLSESDYGGRPSVISSRPSSKELREEVFLCPVAETPNTSHSTSDMRRTEESDVKREDSQHPGGNELMRHAGDEVIFTRSPSLRAKQLGPSGSEDERASPVWKKKKSRNLEEDLASASPLLKAEGWRRDPVLAEEKCVDPLHAAATRQLVADLACLPELVTVCEELRDHCRVLHPEIFSEQLMCLQELVQLARYGQDRGAGVPVAVGPAPALGAFSARRLATNPIGRPVTHCPVAHRGPKPMELDCTSLKSCSPQPESQWSARLHR